jgi:hypothetical protein
MSPLLRKTIAVCLLIAAVLSLFATINYVHFRFIEVKVVLYAAMFDAALAGAIVGAAVSWRTLMGLTKSETVLASLLGMAMAAFIALAAPTVIDRSLSIYILEKLAQRGGGIRETAFEQIFQQEYMKEHHLVDVRLTEQLQSGTIEFDGQCVRLTPKGKMITEFTRFYRTNLLPKHRLLSGKVTDALTDPFRYSQTSVDYKC